MRLAARSVIHVIVITLLGACALSHQTPDGDERAEVDALEVSCAYPWDSFEETGQHERAVAIAGDVGVSTSCGCFSGGLFAPSYADEARAALDCFCEAARTCTPRHGRAYFGGAATEILMDYFVAPTAEGSCTVEVLTGDYPYFWEDGDLVMHEGCAELSCVEDEGGHLRGALTECEPRETP